MELTGYVRELEWGKIGSNSLVAQLAALNDKAFRLNENISYAQLSMGSYPGEVANYKATGETLTAQLPFILNVLSMGKATSIHVHPNKTDADYLHLKEPLFYRDSSHKPEMVIALTPFVGVCGFRPLTEIRDILWAIYPLKKVAVGNSNDFDLLMEGDVLGWRNCFCRLMETELDVITQLVETISKDFGKEMCKYDVLDIFNILKEDFRRDVGVILIFFLNIIRLEPGQAMFADTCEIHSYLSGDCIECLAASDNVLRAGLTTQYKDIKRLFNIVNYNGVSTESLILKPERIDDQRLIFKPPIDDFAITQITLRPEDEVYVLKIEQCPGMMLVLGGQRTLEVNGVRQSQLKRGSILYLPYDAGTELRFISSDEDKQNFLAYIATSNAPPASTTDTVTDTETQL